MRAAVPADGSRFQVKMQQPNLFSCGNSTGVALKFHPLRVSAAAGAHTQLHERFLPRTRSPAAPGFEVSAARRKKNPSQQRSKGGSPKATPIRPPSLFVKQSPVPSRRPLRCVPFSNVLPESSPIPLESKRGENRKKVASSNTSSPRLEKLKSSAQVKEKGGKVSKWASLFDAGGVSSGAESRHESNADAWFDKIFPKNSSSGAQGKQGESSGAPPASPRLSPQQEKSIQQLQTLVKTLGVATRNSSGAAGGSGAGAGTGAGATSRRNNNNKPNKLRPAPVQGGAVDPVPFSSILKKLQNVSSGDHQQGSDSRHQEQMPGRFKAAIDDDEDEEEDQDDEEDEAELSDEEEDEESEMEIEALAESSSSEENEEEESIAEAEEIIAAENLSKMTVVALKSLAKERGLSGYSKMKKDELVQLLS